MAVPFVFLSFFLGNKTGSRAGAGLSGIIIQLSIMMGINGIHLKSFQVTRNNDVDGWYCYLYVPNEIYSGMRETVSSWDQIQKELNEAAIWVQR